MEFEEQPIFIYRCRVMVVRLALTQEVLVQFQTAGAKDSYSKFYLSPLILLRQGKESLGFERIKMEILVILIILAFFSWLIEIATEKRIFFIISVLFLCAAIALFIALVGIK